MAANSSGQVSYLILDSLSGGSKYGLEIIEYISTKTGGNYILKKPTLYSSLTRMEKKGLISSSFWGESELGGKRHYYSITNDGKKSLETLAKEFANSSFDDEEKTQKEEINHSSFSTATNSHHTVELNQKEEFSQTQNKPVFLKQNNMFDLVKTDEENPTSLSHQQKHENEDIIENQMDIFSLPTQEASAQKQPSALEELVKTINNAEKQSAESTENSNNDNIQASNANTTDSNETKLDDGKFLENDEHLVLTPLQQEQNQRLYDTSSELKKYRKKKSFSENQIEMAVVYEKQDDIEIQKSRIEELKASILNLKNSNQKVEIKEKKPYSFENLHEQAISAATKESSEQSSMFEPTNQTSTPTYIKSAPPKEEEEQKDDGVFVTARMDASEIPIQKKILPTNIEVNVYDDNLPAPKRNSNLEPTYKDMMARLFERKREKELQKQEALTPAKPPVIEEPVQMESFADYDSLKKHYKLQGINFNEYKKTTVSRRHNTNLLKFTAASIMFLLSSITSAVLFGIISGLGFLSASTNFMFYTVPLLFFAFAVIEFIKFKTCISKKAMLLYNSVVNWAVFILGVVIVFVINITCGMQYELIPQYLTSLLVPIVAILIAFPINYYIKKFLFKKFGK